MVVIILCHIVLDAPMRGRVCLGQVACLVILMISLYLGKRGAFNMLSNAVRRSLVFRIISIKI